MRSVQKIGIGIFLLAINGCSSSDEQPAARLERETPGPAYKTSSRHPDLAGALTRNETPLEVAEEERARQNPTTAVPEERPQERSGVELPDRKAKLKQPAMPAPETETNQPSRAAAPEKKAPPLPEPDQQKDEPLPPSSREIGTSEVESEDRQVAGQQPSIVIPPSPPRRLPPAAPVATTPPVPTRAVAQKIPQTVKLPAGTVIEIRTAEMISSKTNRTGDIFGATLTEDLKVGAEVLFRRGSDVQGRLLEVIRPGKVKGRASVTFDLGEIGSHESTYALQTNAITIEAESSKGKDAAKVGAATAIGAVLGAVFGGKKGAAIGATTGGGAGTAGVLLSRGDEIEIPAERLFSFRLEEEITVRIQ